MCECLKCEFFHDQQRDDPEWKKQFPDGDLKVADLLYPMSGNSVDAGPHIQFTCTKRKGDGAFGEGRGDSPMWVNLITGKSWEDGAHDHCSVYVQKYGD